MDKYDVKQEIGKGSFGSATIVIARDTGKRFILKKVRLARQNERQRAASKQEMDLVAALRHPYVVTFRECWIERGHTICIVCAYCEGGDLGTALGRVIQSKQRFEEHRLHYWFAQLLQALAYLHENRILHRDIKPSNIFLTHDGDVQVGDFGLAKVLKEGASLASSIVGTPNYMCPEILSEKQYGLPADMWSLGCVCFELTALRPAFTAFNMEGLVQKIKKAAPAQLPAKYSMPWTNVVKAMLNKNPASRPTADELLSLDWMQPALELSLQRSAKLEAMATSPPPRAGPLPAPGEWSPTKAARCASSRGGRPSPAAAGRPGDQRAGLQSAGPARRRPQQQEGVDSAQEGDTLPKTRPASAAPASSGSPWREGRLEGSRSPEAAASPKQQLPVAPTAGIAFASSVESPAHGDAPVTRFQNMGLQEGAFAQQGTGDLDAVDLRGKLALAASLLEQGRTMDLKQVLSPWLLDVGGKPPAHEAPPFQIGDSVVVGRRRRVEGRIRYHGPTAFASGEWVGIELDEPEGKNDGSVDSISYFQCPHGRGIFVRASILRPDA